MNELVKINNTEIMVKEFNSERVVTAWDIGKVHGREVREINQQFARNRDKLVEGEDYFITNKENLKSLAVISEKANNMKEIILFTESGYLMLVKTFTDDLSWQIQRQLVKGYFKLKEIKISVNKDKRLEIMEKNANVRLSKQFSKLAEMTGNARYKEVLIAKSANVVAGEEILPLPKLEQKSYSAAELGAILGISANMVGRIANKHSLKTDRYGYLAQDKAKYSNKEVESFRYYEHSIEEFKKHLKSELI